MLSDADESGNLKKFLTVDYESAKGTYDLYVLFFEQAIRICGQEGAIGFIVPNKILSAEYAEALRGLFIRDAEIQAISDYSSIKVFSASVYPVVLVLRRQKTDADCSIEVMQKGPRRLVTQSAFAKAPSYLWAFILTDFADLVETALLETRPLGSLATVSGAATVAEAYDIKPAIGELGETDIPPDFCKFIVSGNVRPFRTTWDVAPVQYLKSRFTKPVVNLNKIPEGRRTQALKPKIIISGMAKRPVAALDANGDYLSGKSTVIVYDPKETVDLSAITAILNSRIAALIYFGLYSGLALSGGYLRFGPPQISAFPVPKKLDLGDIASCSPEEMESVICRAYSLSPASVKSAYARNFGELVENEDVEMETEDE